MSTIDPRDNSLSELLFAKALFKENGNIEKTDDLKGLSPSKKMYLDFVVKLHSNGWLKSRAIRKMVGLDAKKLDQAALELVKGQKNNSNFAGKIAEQFYNILQKDWKDKKSYTAIKKDKSGKVEKDRLTGKAQVKHETPAIVRHLLESQLIDILNRNRYAVMTSEQREQYISDNQMDFGGGEEEVLAQCFGYNNNEQIAFYQLKKDKQNTLIWEEFAVDMTYASKEGSEGYFIERIMIENRSNPQTSILKEDIGNVEFTRGVFAVRKLIKNM